MTEMLRYRWTSFGPMLDEDGPFVLFVDAKAAIAATENAFRNAEGAWYRAGQEYGYNEGKRDAIAAAVQRVEALVESRTASVEWTRDYEADETGNTRNPRVWIREATAAIKGGQP